MKKYFLLLMSTIIFLSPLYGQIVPNGGFENWTAGNPDPGLHQINHLFM